MESDVTLWELYDWTCRVEEELADLKSAFPDVLKPDRNRLVASLSCLRVSLELRVTSRPAKRHPAPQMGGTAPGA